MNRKLVWRIDTPNSRYLQDATTKKIIGHVIVETQVGGVNLYKAFVGAENNPLWVRSKIKGMNNAKAQVECHVHRLDEAKVIDHA